MWNKYARECPRRDWVAEDVGDAAVRQQVRERARLGQGWELMDLASDHLGQVLVLLVMQCSCSRVCLCPLACALKSYVQGGEAGGLCAHEHSTGMRMLHAHNMVVCTR